MMSKIARLFDTHPRLMAWLLLAIAMLAIFFVASHNLSLELSQSAAMAAATVVLAGLCVWIVFWE